jgi:hypothetical protein
VVSFDILIPNHYISFDIFQEYRSVILFTLTLNFGSLTEAKAFIPSRHRFSVPSVLFISRTLNVNLLIDDLILSGYRLIDEFQE